MVATWWWWWWWAPQTPLWVFIKVCDSDEDVETFEELTINDKKNLINPMNKNMFVTGVCNLKQAY